MAKSEINNINSMEVNPEDASPAIRQYVEVKQANPDSILLYRMGDFYETFFEDAHTMSKELQITLTARDAGSVLGKVPLAGIPAKAVENYATKLLEKGFKVAICEQLEDPKLVKLKANEVIKRGIVRILTPGTIIENNYLNQTSNNYICSIFEEKGVWGLAYSDVSTGEFKLTQTSFDMVLSELARINPVEIIAPASVKKLQPFQIVPEVVISLPDEITKNYNCSSVPEHVYSENFAKNNLVSALQISDLETISYKKCRLGYRSAGALLAYMWENLKESVPKIDRLEQYDLSEYVLIDSSTRKNLELTETMREKSAYGSLYWAINRTNTNMGSRLLKTWICQPLKDIGLIQKRLDYTELIINHNQERGRLIELLKQIYDIQRLATKLSTTAILPKDFTALKNSLFRLDDLSEVAEMCGLNIFEPIKSRIPALVELAELIDKTIVDEPPTTIKEGGIINSGVNEHLDYLRNLINNSEDWLKKFEEEEKEKTGIKNLKVAYNRVFGYYIEITNSNLNMIPSNYHRRQTLRGSERFITEELKLKEDEVLSAQSKIYELEYKLFSDFRKYTSEFVEDIRKLALIIAELDVLVSFSTIALESNYVKPVLTEGSEFVIKNGRHPVLEKILPLGSYVANDLSLSEGDSSSRFMILTGPNMAGKSTYMRQNALIAIMSQIGCYVPADYVRLGVADKIFTRVGASDDLTLGQSTFMVEMVETANILNNATSSSLILIDEIGRGTSTYDGVAIAWAVAEYIASKLNSRCIFATHYHELNVMENTYPQIKNYRVTVSETDGKIEFLRKVVMGGASKSYGIHVAKMAGLPTSVIKRSEDLMIKLQKDFSKDLSSKRKTLTENVVPQLSLFDSVK